MRINHKFLTVNAGLNPLNWGNNFCTRNAILIGGYRPEIMILGTFNPDLETNPADFFYGRNFFWTAFKNLFIHGEVGGLTQARNELNPYNPTLEEIFALCRELKLTFTDLIASIFSDNDNTLLINRANKEYIKFGNIEYNPIKDGDLQKLHRIKKVNWNTPNIIIYLLQNPQVKTVYLTRTDSYCWYKQTDQIRRACPTIQLIPIYTPSAQGEAVHKQTGIYGQGKMRPLLRHWVHNSKGNFGKLDTNWLIYKGVDLNNF